MPRRQIPINLLVAASLVVLPCCGPVSDDPREGGLMGYLQHGEEGYQKRLDSRENELTDLRREGSRLSSTTGSLERDRASMQADLKRHRSAVSSMQGELNSLERQVASGEGQNKALLSEIRSKQGELSAMQTKSGDVDSLNAERSRLQKDVSSLKERARLLLEVQ